MPQPEFTVEQAVAHQLEALRCNDQPWLNHGIQTAYAFALDVGGLEPSIYFGFSKDLYHFDHYAGLLSTRLSHVVNLRSFEVLSVEEVPPALALPSGAAAAAAGTAVVTVAVQGPPRVGDGEAAYRRVQFHMQRKAVGARKGAWMTRQLLLLPEDASPPP